VNGALLSIGDLHAAMGTAEPTWVSLEAAGSATLRISVEKSIPLTFLRLRVGSSTICMGMGETLNDAHQAALDQAFERRCRTNASAVSWKHDQKNEPRKRKPRSEQPMPTRKRGTGFATRGCTTAIWCSAVRSHCGSARRCLRTGTR
jgi:hypothetical protein